MRIDRFYWTHIQCNAHRHRFVTLFRHSHRTFQCVYGLSIGLSISSSFLFFFFSRPIRDIRLCAYADLFVHSFNRYEWVEWVLDHPMMIASLIVCLFACLFVYLFIFFFSPSSSSSSSYTFSTCVYVQRSKNLIVLFIR